MSWPAVMTRGSSEVNAIYRSTPPRIVPPHYRTKDGEFNLGKHKIQGKKFRWVKPNLYHWGIASQCHVQRRPRQLSRRCKCYIRAGWINHQISWVRGCCSATYQYDHTASEPTTKNIWHHWTFFSLWNRTQASKFHIHSSYGIIKPTDKLS